MNRLLLKNLFQIIPNQSSSTGEQATILKLSTRFEMVSCSWKRQSNGVANILGGQTGENLICWGEMFPTTPNMFLSNNIHKNSIFHAFFKFWVQGGPHLQPWHSLRPGLQQHLKPQSFQQHPIRNAHKVFFKE